MMIGMRKIIFVKWREQMQQRQFSSYLIFTKKGIECQVMLDYLNSYKSFFKIILMINIETLAYQLELKTKKFPEINLEIHSNKASFDMVLLMGYNQNFRNPEIAGVLLREGEYSVQYYASMVSSYETF